MRLGISGQALGDTMRFRDIVAIGKQFGIQDFEIWPANAPGEGEDYAARDVKEIARVADGEGIQIFCVTLGAAFDEASCRDAATYRKLLCGALDTAKLLGASVVNHYCYHIHLSSEPDFQRLEAYPISIPP